MYDINKAKEILSQSKLIKNIKKKIRSSAEDEWTREKLIEAGLIGIEDKEVKDTYYNSDRYSQFVEDFLCSVSFVIDRQFLEGKEVATVPLNYTIHKFYNEEVVRLVVVPLVVGAIQERYQYYVRPLLQGIFIGFEVSTKPFPIPNKPKDTSSYDIRVMDSLLDRQGQKVSLYIDGYDPAGDIYQNEYYPFNFSLYRMPPENVKINPWFTCTQHSDCMAKAPVPDMASPWLWGLYVDSPIHNDSVEMPTDNMHFKYIGDYLIFNSYGGYIQDPTGYGYRHLRNLVYDTQMIYNPKVTMSFMKGRPVSHMTYREICDSWIKGTLTLPYFYHEKKKVYHFDW